MDGSSILFVLPGWLSGLKSNKRRRFVREIKFEQGETTL